MTEDRIAIEGAGEEGSYKKDQEIRLLGMLERTILLKDFATSSSIEVDEKTFSIIAELENAAANGSLTSKSADLDKAISLLTPATYPVTIDNISTDAGRESKAYSRFKKFVLTASIIIIPILAVLFNLSFYQEYYRASHQVFSIFLGLMGACVFGLLYVLNMIPRQAFDADDEHANYSRFVVGGLLGWLAYYSICQDEFEYSFGIRDIPEGVTLDSLTLYLILPFLFGYSSSLAVGILNKLLKSVELTLGLEDRRDPMFAKRKKKGQ